MSFVTLYRLSFYLMLFFATLTLSVDATDNPLAILYPIAVAVGGVVALLTADRNPRLGLSRPTANLLALASISLVALEYLINPYLMLLALGHWLVYLQLVKMFLPKTVEDDWWLYLLGLVQVLIGAVISQSDHVGTTLFTWALLALWVLALFSLHRDALRFPSEPGLDSTTAAVPERRLVDPYPGLLEIPFFFSALRVTVMTLALGGIIFLAMPRRASMVQAQSGGPMARHLTGFDEEVELGQMGEILENDSVVMSIELYDKNDRPMSSPPDPLWRGVTMALYENARWHRQLSTRKSETFPVSTKPRRATIRQQIKLEASDSPVLFGLRPMITAEGPGRNPTVLNRIDGTIVRADARANSYDYRVLSEIDPNAPQLGEDTPSPGRQELLLRIPASIRPRLERIAQEKVAKIPPEEVVKRARALEHYLRESGEFSYTLRIMPVDPTLDPVVDFLVNRKEGHCEFYASALTLLLRSIGIPARMVNGFKGGDWNDFAQILNVRQKHAHSWVEAYLGETDENNPRPIWITLDPTPGIERERIVASVGGFSSNFRQLTDLIRYIWVFYIVGYNTERQRRILYDPILELAQKARLGFRIMGEAIRAAAKDLLKFETVGQFISIRGFFVSFTALLLLVFLVRTLHWAWRRFVRWLRGPEDDSALLAPGVVFYRRLTQLLADFGLERPPAETQQEFARRAGVFLTGHGTDTDAVADVPRLVVDAFYRVRFGQRDLAQDALRVLEGRLDDLEASLRASRE